MTTSSGMLDRIRYFVRHIWPGVNVAYCYLDKGRRVFLRFRWNPETQEHVLCSNFHEGERRVIRFCAPRVKDRVGSAAR